MKRIRYHRLAIAAFATFALSLAATAAYAQATCPGTTPVPNSAKVTIRDYNDCPTSTVTVTNAYPASIEVNDEVLDCFGFANRHTWSFSTDGGATDAQFENCSLYKFCADVTLSGTGFGEGGLRLSPWWSPHNDGQFMLNAKTGEIACFGGRMPFYSFTAAYGLTYVKGNTVHMEIIYNPQSLSSSDPATIIYSIKIGSTTYSSPKLRFDQGNAGEDPPHGLWGELWPAYVGGYVMGYLGQGVDVSFDGKWDNICYDFVAATPTRNSTWGRVKTLYR